MEKGERREREKMLEEARTCGWPRRSFTHSASRPQTRISFPLPFLLRLLLFLLHFPQRRNTNKRVPQTIFHSLAFGISGQPISNQTRHYINQIFLLNVSHIFHEYNTIESKNKRNENGFIIIMVYRRNYFFLSLYVKIYPANEIPSRKINTNPVKMNYL